jgi:hypothetical protein
LNLNRPRRYHLRRLRFLRVTVGALFCRREDRRVDGLNVRCAVSCPYRPATVARPNPIWPPGAGHGFRLLSGFRSLWAATAGERLAPDAGGRPLTFTDT